MNVACIIRFVLFAMEVGEIGSFLAQNVIMIELEIRILNVLCNSVGRSSMHHSTWLGCYK